MSKKLREGTNRARFAHHEALQRLSGKYGLDVWRRLRRVEQAISRVSTDYCNGTVCEAIFEEACDKAREQVKAIMGGKLPDGFFINRDPRGYALKIDPKKGTVPEGMHLDFGNYGILAAEIN